MIVYSILSRIPALKSMTLEDYFQGYQRRWFFQTRFEHMFMIVWHASINFFHCLPLWIEGNKISTYSSSLQENGFPLTKSETDALANVRLLMILSPFVVVLIVPLIQFGALVLYYKYGHPWCRLFKHFKQPDETKSKIENQKGSKILV